MNRFHFKLQPLLKKECIYEDECVGRLRAIQDAFLNEKDKLEDIRRCMITSQSELKLKKQHDITCEELITYEDYFLKLGNDINSTNLRLLEITKELRTVQEELAKIIKKRKALEKLRDRWEEEHNSYQVTLSNKEMDDIAMTGYIKKLET